MEDWLFNFKRSKTLHNLVRSRRIHNLKAAGSSEAIFTKKALISIFNLSGGVIRKIGKLAIKTITLGALTKKQKITEQEVLLASKEL